MKRRKGEEESYLLTIDVGNTNTVFAVFSIGKSIKEKIQKHPKQDPIIYWRMHTDLNYTSDEIGTQLLTVLANGNINASSILYCLYASVVPSYNSILKEMASKYLSLEATKEATKEEGSATKKKSIVNITHSTPLALKIKYPNPKEIGADRLVNASAAVNLYPGSSIVIDMGTATTFCVIHREAEEHHYIGGSIAPGVEVAIAQLREKTALLPTFEFSYPRDGIIGKSTIASLEAGFFFGYIGLLKEIITQIRKEEPKRKYQIIGTGGLLMTMVPHIKEIFDIVDPLLTVRGLLIIYKNLVK